MSWGEFVQMLLSGAGVGVVVGAMVGFVYDVLGKPVDWDRNAGWGGALGGTVAVGAALGRLLA